MYHKYWAVQALHNGQFWKWLASIIAVKGGSHVEYHAQVLNSTTVHCND